MSGQLINILGGLLTTLIGYFIGRMWQRVIDRVPYRKARNFWGAMLASEIQVVVSRFYSPLFAEPTGIIGGGDSAAEREISAYFGKLGLKNVEVVHVGEGTLNLDKNLILLGGPDMNAVTEAALELIMPRLEFVDPGKDIPIEVHDLDPIPGSEERYISSAKIDRGRATDYGIVIRTRNPFNDKKGIAIFAGAYGYATWGGIELAKDEDFLRKCKRMKRGSITQFESGVGGIIRRLARRLAYSSYRSRSEEESLQIECLFRVTIFGKRPYGQKPILLRPLMPQAKKT
jgi:hypothetical protein